MGDTWTIYLTSPEEVAQLADDPSCPAFVEPDDRQIYFSNTYDLNSVNIRHELWHVCFHYRYLDSTIGLSVQDVEEISAETFAREGEKLVQLSILLEKKLKELAESKSEEDMEIDLEETKEKGRRKKE
jgi:hypothetical protein